MDNDSSIEILQEDWKQTASGTTTRAAADNSIAILDDDQQTPLISRKPAATGNDFSDDSFFDNLPMDLSDRWKTPIATRKDQHQRDIGDSSTPAAAASSTTPVVSPTDGGVGVEDGECIAPAINKEVEKKLWKRGVYITKRTDVTPAPDFGSFTTPMIKEKLKQYGLRKCPRRKAITLLTKIYNTTHPYLNERGEISDVSTHDDATPRRGNKNMRKKAPRNKTSSSTANAAIDDDLQRRQKTGKSSTLRTKTNGATSSKRRAGGSSNSEEEGEISGGDESNGEMIEESILELSSSDLAEVGDAVQEPDPGSSRDSLNDRLLQFIRTQEDLYKRILTYEPISFKSLRAFIRERGITCSSAKLLDFCDAQGITFTLKDEKAKPTSTITAAAGCSAAADHPKKGNYRLTEHRKRN